MFSTFIKRNNIIYNSKNIIVPTYIKQLQQQQLLYITKSSKPTKSPSKSSSTTSPPKQTVTENLNTHNKLKTHYYSNGLIKSKSLIISLLKSKRLSVFLLYWWIVSPNLPADNDISVYCDWLTLPIFSGAVYDLAIKNNVKNKFYELTIVELIHHRESIESIIKQPFQLPSIDDCKIEINRLYSYENMLNDEKRTLKESTTTTTTTTVDPTDKSISLKKKLIKCIFKIQLDSESGSKSATITAIGETPNTISSFLSNLGRRIPLDEKYQFKNLSILMEPENKNYIIYEDE